MAITGGSSPAVTPPSAWVLSRPLTVTLMALGALTAFVLTNFLGLAVFVAGLFFAVLALFLKARATEASRALLIAGLALLAGSGAHVLLVIVFNLLVGDQPTSGSGIS